MSLAWGGHQNGRIPLSALSPIGKGQLPGGMQFGKQQYVHRVVARAWAALVRAVHAETGVRLKVTEGYRDFALQQHYWNTLPFPQAATPGTSSHGWARAVDMYGYTVSALQAVRRIGPHYGWSLATGDRVGEPWHIEYVASLTSPPDFADSGDVVPITPVMEVDPMKVYKRNQGGDEWMIIHPSLAGATTDERGYVVTTNTATSSQWERAFGKAEEINSATYAGAQREARALHSAYRRGIALAVPAGSTAPGSFTAEDRARLQAVPTAAQNGQAARAAIVK